MFAGDFTSRMVGNMLNRAISGERQNLGESLWEGTLNAVGNAVFGKDPIGGSKGAGKKPINGFRDAYRRGARAAGVTTLVNDLAQMSGIVGGGERQDSGSRYSSTLGRRTTGLDISAVNAGGKQDPRALCGTSDTFSGGIGSQSARGYQQQTGGSGRNKRKSRFSLGKLAGDVIVNSLLGGFTSTMYYGADRAVGAVSNGIRGRRSSYRQKNVDNESGNYSITVSQDRLQHSILGEFNSNGRMINGGHGQANIDFLNQNNIEYNIVKVYDNGVRIGNIPSHKNKFKRTGAGQAWFPESWTEIDIKNAGEYVANISENVNVPDGTWAFSEYNGVRVGIIKNNGKIGTIIPDNSRQP